MVTKRLIGRNEDGSPHYNYLFDDGETNIVATGAGRGLVQLKDGTLYDVTEAYISVETPKHASEVAHHIAVQVETSGALDFVDPTTGELVRFQHTDCDHCDAPKSTGPHSPAALAQVESHRALVEPRPTRKGR